MMTDNKLQNPLKSTYFITAPIYWGLKIENRIWVAPMAG